ncbi:MAG: hypothetical protein JKY50_09445 [Oleispira sp.]|nr:hypothetical protein [Oleispira sp.]
MPFKNLSIKDSRGKESITLGLVFISWAVVVIKFAIAGITIGPLGTMPIIGAGEFGMAVAAILAIWLGREWTEKKNQNKE